MKTFCECKCERNRHRPRAFRSFTGSGLDCTCSAMKPARFELFVGERRILGHISEATKLGVEELRLQLADDPAIDALGPILRNLSLASFVQFEPRHCVAATAEGRTYLQEHPSHV
jgi:hypothetical protein